MPDRSLFLFRRDLRLADNAGLARACRQSDEVVPAFIFDPRQCDPEQNSFFSEHAFAFMIRSLKELRRRLRKRGGRLFVFEGAPSEVLSGLVFEGVISAVHVNRDYTPFSRRRDDTLRSVCRTEGAQFRSSNALLLTEPEEVQADGGGAYHTFTPFRRHAQSVSSPRPRGTVDGPFCDGTLPVETIRLEKYDRHSTDSLRAKGGRTEGIAFLEEIEALGSYQDARHQPAQESLTALSAHHKFGTISVRESLYVVKKAFEDYHKLISQFYWRDFYTHLLFHRPEQLTTSLRPIGRHMPWRNERGEFDRWHEGTTGVPFVDAGMRELRDTGYMHNRARMVVASFLTKDLLVDWRWGAQHFARTLTDYDPAVNAGNWQWAASVGTDYRLRIYNPYSQAEKHDPDAEYIKRWVPELRDVEVGRLTSGNQVDFSGAAPGYPAPIVDRNDAYHRAKAAFEEAGRASGKSR
ncbi:cryptochrome/photolyase family protein [Salinibacter altiplanensis]|uniref:cryptochrome/photolyase family protein n=1 Tax=Salinibacter altiplanensis TaxID=1803181 RepID=UPI00131A1796|nr:deoxyribodipyrimidine photo-lyase [Salinibacter altiplanensis]